MLPVSGVWPCSPAENVRFRWLTPSFFLSIVILAFAILDCILSSKVVLDHGLKIYTIGKTNSVRISGSPFNNYTLRQARLALALFALRAWAFSFPSRAAGRISSDGQHNVSRFFCSLVTIAIWAGNLDDACAFGAWACWWPHSASTPRMLVVLCTVITNKYTSASWTWTFG